MLGFNDVDKSCTILPGLHHWTYKYKYINVFEKIFVVIIINNFDYFMFG